MTAPAIVDAWIFNSLAELAEDAFRREIARLAKARRSRGGVLLSEKDIRRAFDYRTQRRV